jgi:transposase
MPAPLSKDIRKRIIKAKENGDRNSKIAKDLQVSPSVITRLLVLYKETGSIDPRPLKNGRKPMLNEETLAKVSEKINQQPDITLQELKEEYSLPVSLPALCNTINKKLGLRRKKNGSRG